MVWAGPVEKTSTDALRPRGYAQIDFTFRPYRSVPRWWAHLQRLHPKKRARRSRAASSMSCAGALHTLHKLIRIAHEDGHTWLVEMLEYEREGQAAQAAVALEGLRAALGR